jgi:hypothetical protein
METVEASTAVGRNAALDSQELVLVQGDVRLRDVTLCQAARRG